ncbi:MAG: GCN5-related N-acetyltransferase [Gemmatimonadetes bacterium]|nr:GCN5-related N-acetyltransferase [Gemmatimonadota bacterium]
MKGTHDSNVNNQCMELLNARETIRVRRVAALVLFVITISRASPANAEPIYQLMVDAGKHMHDTRGFDNWDPPPITLEQLRADTLERTVLMAHTPEGELVGTITLGESYPYTFDPDLDAGHFTWVAPRDADAVYVNRLAIAPSFQGAGLGRQLMHEADLEAQRRHAPAVRLECNYRNGPLVKWYQDLGFSLRSTRTRGPRELAILEKVLGPP